MVEALTRSTERKKTKQNFPRNLDTKSYPYSGRRDNLIRVQLKYRGTPALTCPKEQVKHVVTRKWGIVASKVLTECERNRKRREWLSVAVEFTK